MRRRILADPDWILVLATLALTAVGVAFIHSATSGRLPADTVPWYQERWVRQLLAALLGISLAAGSCLVDYRRLARWAPLIYGLSIALLVLVLLLPPIVGVRRWIPLGFVNFQPSELSKLALILFLSRFLVRRRGKLQAPGHLLCALGWIALPFLLVLIEPDLGSAVVLVPVGLAILYVGGISGRHLVRLVVTGVLLVLLLLSDVLLSPPPFGVVRLPEYQKNRLRVYFGLSFAPGDAGPEERKRAERERRKHSYNIEQALISVGSGGLTGKGWRKGTQNIWGYLPRGVAHNDFIFSVIAEETGFAGSLAVIVLYGTVILGALRIARACRDPLGRNLATGVATLWFCHVFINIGMNIRIMPVTGLPLPLLSDGGSSALFFLLSIGLLQNIHIHRGSY